jgi:hypothetical protein
MMLFILKTNFLFVFLSMMIARRRKRIESKEDSFHVIVSISSQFISLNRHAPKGIDQDPRFGHSRKLNRRIYISHDSDILH